MPRAIPTPPRRIPGTARGRGLDSPSGEGLPRARPGHRVARARGRPGAEVLLHSFPRSPVGTSDGGRVTTKVTARQPTRREGDRLSRSPRVASSPAETGEADGQNPLAHPPAGRIPRNLRWWLDFQPKTK